MGARHPSPTTGLLVGLLITLDGGGHRLVVHDAADLAVCGRCRPISADRNRRDSLQLLRIQGNLNALALTMRDMLDNDEPYPLAAWESQFDRIRLDLQDALQREEELAGGSRTPEQRQYLTQSVSQFWDAADRIFALARERREDEARAQIRESLQARQAALGTAVARLLVENNVCGGTDRRAGAEHLPPGAACRSTGSSAPR